MEQVVRLVEEVGVKIPWRIKTRGTPQSLRNYLRGREKLIEMQVSALEEKVLLLQKQLEMRRKQLEVLKEAIEQLGGE